MKIIFLLWILFLYLINSNITLIYAKELKNQKFNEIFIVSNGWHTGFIIPSKGILTKIPDLGKRYKNVPYIEFGWGDQDFYQSEEFSIGTAIKAVLWPTDSVIHSVAIPKEVEKYFTTSEIEKICLSDERLSALIIFISNSFYRNKSGNLEKLKNGLYGNSQFYKAVDDFHIMNTCNRWTANGLKSIGLGISTTSKLTSASVMSYIKEAKQDMTLNNTINCKSELN